MMLPDRDCRSCCRQVPPSVPPGSYVDRGSTANKPTEASVWRGKAVQKEQKKRCGGAPISCSSTLACELPDADKLCLAFLLTGPLFPLWRHREERAATAEAARKEKELRERLRVISPHTYPHLPPPSTVIKEV